MNTELEMSQAMVDEIDMDTETKLDSIINSLKKMATVSELLRFSGALIIVASMSVFLIQGFEATNDMQRYLALLLQTVLLTAGGFAMSYLLKENKGARVFFGLGLISIPANFTVLGALVYSVFKLDSQHANYPSFSHWVAPDTGSVLLTLAGAAVVLVPVALLGFSVMARKSARPLTFAFVISNLALLVPLRGSAAIGILAAGVVFFSLWFIARYLREDLSLKTPGGWLARVLLFVPAIIMFCRSLYLYEINSLVVAAISIAGFVIFRQVSAQLEDKSGLRFILEMASVPLAIATSLSVAIFLNFTSDSAAVLTILIINATLMLELIHRTKSPKLARALSVGTALITAASSLLVGMFDTSTLFIASSVTLCAAVGCYGVLTRRGLEMFIGIIAVAVILVFQFGELLSWIDFSNWLVLGTIGAVAVVTGSVLERHGVALKLRTQQWAASFSKRVEDTN